MRHVSIVYTICSGYTDIKKYNSSHTVSCVENAFVLNFITSSPLQTEALSSIQKKQEKKKNSAVKSDLQDEEFGEDSHKVLKSP